MKFGAVPLDQAEGAILAHSLRLDTGRLRKGVVLNAQHLAALGAQGLQTVTVAQLGPDDVHEDAAALQLAQALWHDAPHLELSAAFTGRVNLLATSPGVVCLDTGQITQANAVDPMITVATVPAFHQIHAGGLVATVKIIAYGVDSTGLSEACEAAKGAVHLATPQRRTASLIVTEIAGAPPVKGIDAIENRMIGLGGTLSEVLRVPHEDAALTEALGRATGDIVLILTGSATSDIGDTGPQALIRAGGQMRRFGLPVDPGNLLFFGYLGTRPVVGLPGSARSPVLHGADWVVSRLACGLQVSDADIAAMGVGGLLKEIPTRPQPRHPGKSSR
ncbi:MAG: molybdopterin-binding protein [Roseovarius sp.]